jgi:hypothetical protein
MVRSGLVKGAVAAAAMLAAATLGAAPRQAWTGPGYGPGYGMGPGYAAGPGYGAVPGYGPGMMGGWQGRGPGYGPGAGPGYGPGYNQGYGQGYGPGMMGRGQGFGPGAYTQNLPPLDKPLTLDSVPARVQAALTSWGYPNMVVDEVIQFSPVSVPQVGWRAGARSPMAAVSGSFYVLVKERDTGRGALELLVDPATGAVWSEPGPAMMWNTKYGHRAVFTGAATTDIGAEKAKAAARDWLTARGDTTAYQLDVTPMYGYYSIHLMRDGKVEGMLGVNASTGAVWYHGWHGTFVALKDLGK